MGRRHRNIFRVPSLNKRVAARTSWKRVVRHRMGVKAPRGYGWFTNPRKAAYNRIYNRTSIGCATISICLIIVSMIAFTMIIYS